MASNPRGLPCGGATGAQPADGVALFCAGCRRPALLPGGNASLREAPGHPAVGATAMKSPGKRATVQVLTACTRLVPAQTRIPLSREAVHALFARGVHGPSLCAPFSGPTLKRCSVRLTFRARARLRASRKVSVGGNLHSTPVARRLSAQPAGLHGAGAGCGVSPINVGQFPTHCPKKVAIYNLCDNFPRKSSKKPTKCRSGPCQTSIVRQQ